MFELFGVSSDGKCGYVFDTNDFTVETHFISNIKKLVGQGIKIKGVTIAKNRRFIFRNVNKELIYCDNKFAFLNSTVEDNTYQNNIEVIAKGADLPSYSFGYNIWIHQYFDKIKPVVIKRLNGVYEIKLFGDDTGFSVCVLDVGNDIIKPIYRDKTYVRKFPELTVQYDGKTYEFFRR